MSAHPSRPARRPLARRSVAWRSAVGAATVAGVTLLGAGAASAHVSPDKTEVPAGGYTDVQLLVPHGCDGSPTNTVEVQVPEALTTASPYVVAGWTAETTKEALPEPIDDGHGGQLTERDALITWTAEPGNALLDGQRLNFGIGFQAPEEVGEMLYFKTIQTCDEGTGDWITEWDGEGEEPEKPAPAVMVVEGTGGGHGDEAAEGEDEEATETTEVAAEPVSASTSTSDDDDGDSSQGIAIAGLVAGLAGLGLGGTAFAKARKA